MKSIRRQLIRRVLALILLLVGGGLTALYLVARAAEIEQFDATLRAKALAISTLTQMTEDGPRLNFTDRFLHDFDDRVARDFFQVVDPRGRTIARSESLGEKASLPFRTGSPNHPARWNMNLPDGRPGRALAYTYRPKVRPQQPGNSSPELKLVVASDREELNEVLWHLLLLAAGLAGLLVAATLWVVPRVLRRGLAPLDDLATQTSEIDAGSLARRFVVADLPQELQPIASRLNDLLGRLERSFERERRFSADLAHELRTPLAELKALTECAVKWPESRGPSTDEDALAIVADIERLVTHLLALARGEQGQIAVVWSDVSLASFVEEEWRKHESFAADKGLRVSLHATETTIAADPTLLRAILNNLFENAVEYCPAGDELGITVAGSVKDGARIVVANPTSDLVAEDVPHLFDRFWRKEAARSGGKHVGLGLCLARMFAETMHWRLEAGFDRSNRLAFTITIPAECSDPSGSDTAATESPESC